MQEDKAGKQPFKCKLKKKLKIDYFQKTMNCLN